MNLSLQLGRALCTLGFALIAGVCAFAQSAPMADADAAAPQVARQRLEIVGVPALPQVETHWVVASVRVGMPEQAAAPPLPRHVAAARARGAARG